MDQRHGAGAGRLSRELGDRSASYRGRLALDLGLVAELVRSGYLDEARRTLDEHATALARYGDGLEQVVADAIVEREAEAIVAASHAVLADAATTRGATAGAVPEPAPRTRRAPRRLRRALASSLTAVGLVVAFAALAVPSLRPQVTSESVETAAWQELTESRRRLAALRGSGSELLEAEALAAHHRALALPAEAVANPDVHAELVGLCEDQLEALAANPSPQARSLVAEVRWLWSVLVGPGTGPLIGPGLPLPHGVAGSDLTAPVTLADALAGVQTAVPPVASAASQPPVANVDAPPVGGPAVAAPEPAAADPAPDPAPEPAPNPAPDPQAGSAGAQQPAPAQPAPQPSAEASPAPEPSPEPQPSQEPSAEPAPEPSPQQPGESGQPAGPPPGPGAPATPPQVEVPSGAPDDVGLLGTGLG